MDEFRKELKEIIYKHSCENVSDTPDFILAEYLHACLDAFDSAVRNRGTWMSTPVYNEDGTIVRNRKDKRTKEE